MTYLTVTVKEKKAFTEFCPNSSPSTLTDGYFFLVNSQSLCICVYIWTIFLFLFLSKNWTIYVMSVFIRFRLFVVFNKVHIIYCTVKYCCRINVTDKWQRSRSKNKTVLRKYPGAFPRKVKPDSSQIRYNIFPVYILLEFSHSRAENLVGFFRLVFLLSIGNK